MLKGRESDAIKILEGDLFGYKFSKEVRRLARKLRLADRIEEGSQ